jgi:hypothetical protein
MHHWARLIIIIIITQPLSTIPSAFRGVKSSTNSWLAFYISYVSPTSYVSLWEFTDVTMFILREFTDIE